MRCEDAIQQAENDEIDLPAILRDVRVLARHGSFAVAARRFGELRLENGRHLKLERDALRWLGAGHFADLQRLAASRTRLLRLEAICAAALDLWACAEYEAAADALEQELLTYAALEQKLNRYLHRHPVLRRPKGVTRS